MTTLRVARVLTPRETRLERQVREIRARAKAARERMPAPVPASARTSARGTNGSPMYATADETPACPTDPRTGRMIEPERALVRTGVPIRPRTRTEWKPSTGSPWS